MITVAPLKDKKEIESFFQKSGLDMTGFSGCVTATADGELLGYCLYELYEKGITVLYITPKNDLPLADGILRSTLNVAAQRSAMDARYEGKDNEELFKKLGFVLDANENRLDIDKLFSGCSHKG